MPLSESLLTWTRCHNKSRCWHECRRRRPEERNVIWWRAEGGTYSARSGWEPVTGWKQLLIYSAILTTQPDATQPRVCYLFALRWGRVVAVVGQVPSEDVELAGNHPPRVPNLDLVLGGQEDSELAGGEGRRRHRWALPGPQPTQRAVRHLQESDDPINKKKGFCNQCCDLPTS